MEVVFISDRYLFLSPILITRSPIYDPLWSRLSPFTLPHIFPLPYRTHLLFYAIIVTFAALLG